MCPRKAVDQELTREIIMDAARELFFREGYQHVSMRKIAKELKYSHGAIYYYFKNKAELFYALVEQDFSLLDQELENILSENIPSKQKLVKVLLGFIQFGLTHQNHYEIMFLTKDEEIKNYLAEGPNLSYERFAQAIYTLTNKKTNLQEIWSMFLMLHGFVAHYCRSGQTFDDVSELAKLHVNQVLTSIGVD